MMIVAQTIESHLVVVFLIQNIVYVIIMKFKQEIINLKMNNVENILSIEETMLRDLD